MGLCDTPVSVFPLSAAQDADGGFDPSAGYPPTPSAVLYGFPQCTDSGRSDDDGRRSTVNAWLILFEGNPGVRVADRLDFAMPDGAAHSVRVDGQTDAGGRGRFWEVMATELL